MWNANQGGGFMNTSVSSPRLVGCFNILMNDNFSLSVSMEEPENPRESESRMKKNTREKVWKAL